MDGKLITKDITLYQALREAYDDDMWERTFSIDYHEDFDNSKNMYGI